MTKRQTSSGWKVGHLIVRVERARAGLNLMEKLCIRGQDATAPLKPADFRDFQELTEFVCGILTGTTEPTPEGKAIGQLARRPLVSGRFCR